MPVELIYTQSSKKPGKKAPQNSKPSKNPIPGAAPKRKPLQPTKTPPTKKRNSRNSSCTRPQTKVPLPKKRQQKTKLTITKKKKNLPIPTMSLYNETPPSPLMLRKSSRSKRLSSKKGMSHSSMSSRLMK